MVAEPRWGTLSPLPLLDTFIRLARRFGLESAYRRPDVDFAVELCVRPQSVRPMVAVDAASDRGYTGRCTFVAAPYCVAPSSKEPVLRSALLKTLWSMTFPVMAGFRAYRSFVRDRKTYLHVTGWWESAKRGYPCSLQGEPLPWMNYAAVAFLEERLKNSFRLFEFGSGYSTMFYARKVGSVTSVEHDEAWHAFVRHRVPENVELFYRAEDQDGAYCRAIGEQQIKYDVVIVDGRDRVNCLRQSLEHLEDDGVVVLDDSDRERYREGIAYAQARGFRALVFEGLIPTRASRGRATVLYRRKNCLGL
jgi:hypothetical protein